MSKLTDIPTLTSHESVASRPSRPKIRLNGIAAIALISSALALTTAAECHSITYPPSLLYGFVLWGWWGCVGSIFWRLGQRAPSALGFSAKSIATHLLLSCVLGATHLMLLGSLGFSIADWGTHAMALSIRTSLLNINRFGLELLIYGFIFGITGIVQFQVRAQRDAMKALELEKQLSAAHLRALQMQLEPHFLFNTLNAITTLVEFGRQKEAAEMLMHLNSILKSTLKRTTPEKVPLSQELEIIENYLAIEQIRFADRLHIELKVEPGALDGLVPCFLLQPIVENAIRHGIAHCEHEGKVEVSARRKGDFMHLRIHDSGPGSNAQSKPGHGIGLSNTKDRLAHFYPGVYDMTAQLLETDGFEVAIKIPYERG
ncbi:sensor histidine kinase [Granulicella arctica]|uniref:Sensor histidine kinase YesM n=1 Tax=Granulicella arctica TaxID=940613 RepID=A0A7Y9PKN4_9BACT|nr:histidine kinase [Granulicella arctica]NYF80871.1 sensor histidine kinase YesM [Granulicella arctica]